MLWPFGSTWRPVRTRRGETVDLRWLSARTWTWRWYPQGIDLGEWRGRRALAISWFRQDRAGRHLASRVTFVDLGRSRHLDVILAVAADDGTLEPARIHAGGLAWFGDRLFAAATGQGIWEFDLADIRRVRGADARRLSGVRRRGTGASVLVAVRTQGHPVALRCSFLGRVFDGDDTPLRRVLIGEYRTDESGVVGEFAIPDDDGSFVELRRFTPGIAHMQGAVRWGERIYVSQSDLLRPGVLWSGTVSDGLKRDRTSLPVGCEDLALDLDDELLWSLGEHPWRRVVRGIPLSTLGIHD